VPFIVRQIDELAEFSNEDVHKDCVSLPLDADQLPQGKTLCTVHDTATQVGVKTLPWR
jgi:hypothetical protein